MPISGMYGTRLQSRILDAYKRLGLTDESFGAALSEADGSGECVGSARLVSAWRMGRLQSMTLGALDVLLTHAGERAGELLDAACEPYGFRAVPREAAPPIAGDLERAGMRAGRLLGEVLGELERATAGGEVTAGEAAAILRAIDATTSHLAGLRARVAAIQRGRPVVVGLDERGAK